MLVLIPQFGALDSPVDRRKKTLKVREPQLLTQVHAPQYWKYRLRLPIVKTVTWHTSIM